MTGTKTILESQNYSSEFAGSARRGCGVTERGRAGEAACGDRRGGGGAGRKRQKASGWRGKVDLVSVVGGDLGFQVSIDSWTQS